MVEVYRREEAAGRAAKWLASERRCVHGLSASDAERSRRAATALQGGCEPEPLQERLQRLWERLRSCGMRSFSVRC